MMKLGSGNEQAFDVPPRIRKPTAEETFHVDPLITWVATVALVLIFILVALSLAARREQKKQTKAVHGAQYAREKASLLVFPRKSDELSARVRTLDSIARRVETYF